MSYLSAHSQQVQVDAASPHLDFQVLHVAVCGHNLMRGDGAVGYGPEFDGGGEGEGACINHVA